MNQWCLRPLTYPLVYFSEGRGGAGCTLKVAALLDQKWHGANVSLFKKQCHIGKLIKDLGFSSPDLVLNYSMNNSCVFSLTYPLVSFSFGGYYVLQVRFDWSFRQLLNWFNHSFMIRSPLPQHRDWLTPPQRRQHPLSLHIEICSASWAETSWSRISI